MTLTARSTLLATAQTLSADCPYCRIEELEAEVARLKQDKVDALNVRSKDDLLSSEWIARTGAAERRAEAAEAENITFRNAQKACETCDGPTIAEFKEMKAEDARLCVRERLSSQIC